jgi:Tol biopolymer transport system component
MLGLSSDVQALGGSIIYTVPVTGGTPKQITPKGPSYLHGWSPDGKTLVFTGQRNKKYILSQAAAAKKCNSQQQKAWTTGLNTRLTVNTFISIQTVLEQCSYGA